MPERSPIIGMVTVDPRGLLLAWNFDAESLLNLSPGSKGSPLAGFFTEKSRPGIERLLSSSPGPLPLEQARPDGSVRTLELRPAGLPGEGEEKSTLLILESPDPERRSEAAEEESHVIETINRVGRSLAAELDLQKLVQNLTDAATEITGAQFGAFFYNVLNAQGESYMLYTLSGVPREAFAKFPMPRNTAVFDPTFKGEGILRSDDITKDPRYGKNHPRKGMPEGHLPVHSYLAVPVTSRSDEVLGGLFFGHSETGRFSERHERMIVGIASQAAVAIDNARLYQQAREAEERLREQLEFTNAITHNLGEGIITLDREGRATFLNPAAERMLGWRIDEIRGRDIHDTIHYQYPDGRPFPIELCAQREALRTGGTVYNAENVYTRKDGTMFPVSVTSSPIFKEGEIVGAVLLFRDLTEQQRAEATLRDNEYKLRALFENTTDAILIADDAGNYLDANPAAAEVIGAPLDGIIGRNVADFSPPEYRDLVLENWRRFLREGEQEGEFPLFRPDGTSRYLEYKAKANFLPGNHLSVLRDITGRKRMEEALRESEEQFRTLIEQSPLSVQIISPQGETLQVNRAWERLWGITLDQLRGYDMFRDRQLEDLGIMPYIRRGFAGEAAEIPPVLYNLTHTLPDVSVEGSPERWVRAFIYPVRNPSGEITKVVLIHEDVSVRQRLEDELRRRAEELAEEGRRKDHYLAMLAHELRNPLAPIVSAVHIMKMQGGDDPALLRSREVIERQVNHMARLIDNLLELSRIDRGKIALQKRALDLRRVLEDAAASVRPFADSRRHELNLGFPDAPVTLEADPDRLEQILVNLLNNAAKYTEPGGRIDLTGGREGAEIVFRVRDTGIGIEPEMLPHVFDLFAQADRSLDRSRGGLGIGLTLVKNLVRLHEGKVEAHSAGPGHGSEFVVRLPVTDIVKEPPPVQKALLNAAPVLQAPLNVLLIEDNADGREMLRKLLELWGHRLEVAENGSEGVERALRNPFQAAVIDIGLPSLDGYEVARTLREELGERCPTLIALTGYGQPEARRKALEAGFDAYLVKPADPVALSRLLADVGQKSGSGGVGE